MKKSKIVTIGLLAVALSSCHHRQHRHPTSDNWNSDPNYYVSDDGYSYQPGYPGMPFWFYYSMMYRPGWGVYSSSGVVYHNHYYGSSRGWSYSEGGRSGSMGRSVGRGGFGSSGHGVGA